MINLTSALNGWQAGEATLAPELLEAIYRELRRAAGRQMRRERSSHTLQATAVANEAYLRLREVVGQRFKDRAHFSAFAARLVRRVLVDHAREQGRLKRGAGAIRVELEAAEEEARAEPPDLLALDEALDRLAGRDATKGRIVELRFFGGLSVPEIATALAMPRDRVALEWRRAKAWLRRELEPRGATSQ